jgi:hypothetical protein
MSLTPDERALLPTDDDVSFYREHGWYRSKMIIRDDVLDEAMLGVERHFAGERDWQLPPTSGFSDWRPGDGNGIRTAEVVALQNRQLRKLVMYPLLGAIAARLAASPTIRYFADTLIYKPPQLPGTESVVGWHTDRAYWGTCTSDEMLTAWIPFHDCPAEMGPVMYLDGSHRWPGTSEMRTYRRKDLSEMERRFADQGPMVKVPMMLRKGEVSFHVSRLVHGSEPNLGRGPRIALALHLQDGANRFRLYLNEKGIAWHIFNDDLARKLEDGTPDYGDPNVFPVLWTEHDPIRVRDQVRGEATPEDLRLRMDRGS